MSPGNTYLAHLDRFARTGAILVVCVGAAVIVGWLLNLPTFKSVLPGLATMKVNTAFGFIASGAALWLIHTTPAVEQPSSLARVLCVFVVAIGGLSIGEYVFDVNLGIDELLFADHSPIPSLHPGRMSPATALAFFAIGLALLALKARRPLFAATAHWVVTVPLFIATLAVVGYAYSVTSLHRFGAYNSLAFHTTLSFLVLSLCLIAADTNYGFAWIAKSDTAGGAISRRLLPTLPFLLFFLGLAWLLGELWGFYDIQFGLAIMVLSSIAVCLAAVTWTATSLHETDIARQRGVAEIMSLNAELEQRVTERTKELEQALAALSTANKALEQLSLEDGLTGIANRRCLDAQFAIYLAMAHRQKRPLGLVLYDVDFFKAFNDHYGHHAGDICLRQVAAALQSCCRRPGDLVARFGGEEFAMLLPDTDLDGVVRIAEMAREAVAELRIQHAPSPIGKELSISGGVSVLSRYDGTTAERMIIAADENLYEAKRRGRNQIYAGIFLTP